MRKLVICCLSSLALWSCGSEENLVQKSRAKIKKEAEQKTVEKEEKEEIVEVDKDAIFQALKSIPSPLETSALITSLEPNYSGKILADPEKREEYTSSADQAVNLGIYGADLGYVNMYEERTASIGYLMAVKHLAEQLKIGQFFDFNTIRNLANNSKNIDSLLYMSQRSFEKMNEYLELQGRTDVSAQLLLGGWLEGLYLTTQVAKSNDANEIKEAIGEQKVALNEIMFLVDNFRNKEKFNTLVGGFDQLNGIYKNVTIEYIEGESSMEIVNGIPTMVSTSRSEVKITDDQVKEITETVEKFRTELIK